MEDHWSRYDKRAYEIICRADKVIILRSVKNSMAVVRQLYLAFGLVMIAKNDGKKYFELL